MLRRVTSNEFLEDHEVTVGVEFGTLLFKIEDMVLKLQVWDTAGQENFKSISRIFYRGSHCVFLTYDICEKNSFENIDHWLREI